MAASPDRPFTARIDALRVPPHSIDAEQAVLGGLMLDERAWERIADKLYEEDFYRKDHRLIYRAIGDLANKNMPCDAVTLGEWFESKGIAELVDWARTIGLGVICALHIRRSFVTSVACAATSATGITVPGADAGVC